MLRRIFGPKRDEATGGGENCVMSTLIRHIPHQNFLGDQIEMNDMRGACSTHGGKEKCIQGFDGET